MSGWQRRTVSRGRQAKSDRLLARLGVLRCGTCASRMVINSDSGSYRCGDTRANRCRRRAAVKADRVEEMVLDAVRVYSATADALRRNSRSQQIREADEAIERANADLDDTIRQLGELGLLGRPASQETLEKLATALDDAHAARARLGDRGESNIIGPDEIDKLREPGEAVSGLATADHRHRRVSYGRAGDDGGWAPESPLGPFAGSTSGSWDSSSRVTRSSARSTYVRMLRGIGNIGSPWVGAVCACKTPRIRPPASTSATPATSAKQARAPIKPDAAQLTTLRCPSLATSRSLAKAGPTPDISAARVSPPVAAWLPVSDSGRPRVRSQLPLHGCFRGLAGARLTTRRDTRDQISSPSRLLRRRLEPEARAHPTASGWSLLCGARFFGGAGEWPSAEAGRPGQPDEHCAGGEHDQSAVASVALGLGGGCWRWDRDRVA